MIKQRVLFLLLIIVLVIQIPLSVSADVIIQSNTGESIVMTDLFSAKTFTSQKGTKINYRIFLPQDYSTQKKYPLILFLHGVGQRGDNNQSQLEIGISESFKNPNSEIYQCIVVAPQCPSNALWVDTKEFWDVYCDYDSEKIKETAALAAVAELFTNVQDEYSVDKNRVYGIGISMGGFGIWDLLVRHPKIFTAAMPICGGADYRKAELIKDVPIWTFHGEKDEVVPCRGTKKMVSALTKVNGNIQYTPYPEDKHTIWEKVLVRDDVYSWLLGQKFSDRYPDEYQLPDEMTQPEPTQPIEPPVSKKSSCKSSIGCIAPVVASVSVATFALRKKKKKEK